MPDALLPLCRLTAGLALTLALALPLQAEPIRQEARFDLVMLGLTAGSLQFSGIEDGGRYSVRGVLSSGGILAFLRKVSYDARANGRVVEGAYRPARYAERADTGKRVSEAVMEYPRGVPKVVSYNPPREPQKNDVDPATMAGTVDPLTALYATLRDVDPGQECQVTVPMFDGRRSSRLSITAPVVAGDEVTCQGEYRRIAGFSDKDMAEKTVFPFTLVYEPAADGRMRVMLVEMETLYGTARLVRR
ncbi:MAG: hypothetical protein CFE34_15360 [Rhodobacteraceae bacterium PARR1]|nr:MAG: hypothetical protein CFE34_15360 [Rhodobacteraceae bacterium PARR1]